MLSLEDILGQLGSLFNGGDYQGNGATTFAAPQLGGPSVVGSSASFPALGGAASGASGLGFNLGTGQLALGGLSALNSIIGGNKALNLAQDQFKFQKGLANTNLNNQIKSYNTALEDRLTARGVAQGQDAATVAAAIERNRLSR
jgi:hypothetical protein